MTAATLSLDTSSATSDALPPLSAEGLHLSFGKIEVLRGASLQLPQGQILGLIGRNGAGKSTLIQCLLGLLQPHQGAAYIFGTPVLKMDDRCKQRLSYVPQQPQSFGWMCVQDLMCYLSQLYDRWDKAHADRLLKRWELPPNHAIGKLSPGQAQRLALVRALASRPDLLVLDEPASALDPVARRELMRDIVEQALDNGATVLFSSHIISDLERIASHVAFLHNGQMRLNQPLDVLKETAMRVLVPAEHAQAAAHYCNNALAHHALNDGSLSLVTQDANALQQLHALASVRIEPLSLEDLFIAVTE